MMLDSWPTIEGDFVLVFSMLGMLLTPEIPICHSGHAVSRIGRAKVCTEGENLLSAKPVRHSKAVVLLRSGDDGLRVSLAEDLVLDLHDIMGYGSRCSQTSSVRIQWRMQ
jgi:hypothetical protein